MGQPVYHSVTTFITDSSHSVIQDFPRRLIGADHQLCSKAVRCISDTTHEIPRIGFAHRSYPLVCKLLIDRYHRFSNPRVHLRNALNVFLSLVGVASGVKQSTTTS
jgi:hypothetical protein